MNTITQLNENKKFMGEIDHQRLNIEKDLISFKRSLHDRVLIIFEEKDQKTLVKMMFTLVQSSAVKFFDAQMYENLPKFISVLIALNPEIIMTSKKINLIPVDEDEDGDKETTIYDQVCDFFVEALCDDSIKLGIGIGVFKENDGNVDLTPEIAG